MANKLYWLSYSDNSKPQGQRFAGVVIVEAENEVDARTAGILLGADPEWALLQEDVTAHANKIMQHKDFVGTMLNKDGVDMLTAKVRGTN